MAGNWPRGIQRIPGTSPFVPHDSHLPINSLYDKIPIQGLGPKFIACRQTLKPLVQFREILIGQCRVHGVRIVLIDPGCAPIVLWQEDGLVFFLKVMTELRLKYTSIYWIFVGSGFMGSPVGPGSGWPQ